MRGPGRRRGPACALVLLALALVACARPLPPPAAAPDPAPPAVAPCTPEGDAAMGRGDLAAALHRHRELVDREPGNGLAWYHLGFILGETGDLAGEIAAYERALAAGLGGEAQVHANLGLARGEAGDTSGAREAFQRALALEPCNADAWYGLGSLEVPPGAAEEAFRRALDCDPGHRPARDRLIAIYTARGDVRRARELVRQAPLQPSTPAAGAPE